MTVSYTADIANGRKFICFWRVLLRWRGSLYKLIWQDILCYCALFVVINYIQVTFLPTHMQLIMQNVKSYLSSNISTFPVPFVLSFFVDQVATKWWHQYQMVPSPDTLAIYTNAAIPGKDEKSRMMRRTIVRYAILSLVLTLRNISTRVKNRFPTVKHVEEIGLITDKEKAHYDKLDEGQVTANMWMPLVWAANVATHARDLKKISSDQCLRLLITELTAHRDKLGILIGYDLVSIPLVYTQTMIVVVVSYVFITLFGHQPITDGSDLSLGFTFTALTNFIIYVGLMKVATVMLNPFGDDDDDFELNATIDRHINAAYMIVDEMNEEEPDIVKDAFWDEIVPTTLQYTVGSLGNRKLEHNYYERVASKSTEQMKNSFSDRRQPMKGMSTGKAKFGGIKEDSKSKINTYNNITNNYKSFFSRSSSNDQNKTFNISKNTFLQEDVDVYDFSDNTKALTTFQQPSTSKQFFL